MSTPVHPRRRARTMILAGDIGGTKTLLGLFDPRTGAAASRSYVRSFVHDSTFSDLSDDDLRRSSRPTTVAAARRSTAACFGVAGPVLGETAELTNVPLAGRCRRRGARLRHPHVPLLNDLEAMAYSVPVLDGDELHVLQRGEAMRGGNMALIAAGTGLGAGAAAPRRRPLRPVAERKAGPRRLGGPHRPRDRACCAI